MMFRFQGVFYLNVGYIRIRARSLRGSFVPHFWVTTPANLDLSNQFSMRIIRRLSEDSRRDPPHDTSMGPACKFNYVAQFGSEDSWQDLLHVIHEFDSDMFECSLCNYIWSASHLPDLLLALLAKLKKQHAFAPTAMSLLHMRCLYCRLQLQGLFGRCNIKGNGEL